MNQIYGNNFRPWVIAKFGGTSVKDKPCWQHITQIIRHHLELQHRIVVVCSAPSQVSNHLEKLIEQALSQNYEAQYEFIHSVYEALATALNVPLAIIQDDLARLKQLCQGVALLNEFTPRVKAQIMAFGELMLTKLGHAYLQQQDIESVWEDARNLLRCDEFSFANEDFLNVSCTALPDDDLIEHVEQLNQPVIMTQGFIASNPEGETVLLGRGGSDSSAAYFAVKLRAAACEIWTDVPGIYTANPQQIPEARLLRQLEYAEAQEIASLGGKVLHPNCIAPLAEQQIPLYVKFTHEPKREGSKVALESAHNNVPIKAVITRYNILLISMESINMWKQAGFLAEVFQLFKRFRLSIDLMSTSESNVTISLDPLVNYVDDKNLKRLLIELNKVAMARLIGPCASISLIGRHIRASMHQISDLFEVFASQKVYLLSQAANDLNLTFVVDSDQAARLAKHLHVLLIEQNPKSYFIGKSWLEEYGDQKIEISYWWQKKAKKLLALTQEASPLYVYDEETLADSADKLIACHHIDKIHYAMKANPHPDILRVFYHKGINFECVSMAEVEHVLDLFPDIDPKRILFTPNFAPKQEYQQALQLDINLTIDSIYPFTAWPELFSQKEVLLRIDPGQGGGHHKYVNTGGSESKFGIVQEDLLTIVDIASQYRIKIIGLQAHSGSGILQADIWQKTAKLLTGFIRLFPEVTIIDVGGGLGVVEKPAQQPLDLKQFNESLASIKSAYPQVSLWLEPGRYLVATAGVLLATVTQIKQKENLHYIGVNTGMNSLIRPALYGSYHDIVNLSKLNETKEMLANIVGPICETGDTLGYSRVLPKTEAGDILLINTAGAYGHCMSSYYNLRAPAKEYFLNEIK